MRYFSAVIARTMDAGERYPMALRNLLVSFVTPSIFAAGVAALDDDTLIAEAEAAYSAFQARLDHPASAPHQGTFAALKQACAAPAE